MARKKKSSNKRKAVAKPKKSPQKKVSKKVIDIQKSKAGKVRGSTGIRDSKGRYISKLFTNEVKLTLLASKGIDVKNIHADNDKKIQQLVKENNINPASVKKFYDKNKFAFEQLNEKGEITGTWKNSNNIKEVIDNYQGEIFINDGKKTTKVSKDKASLIIDMFKTSVSSSINAQEFALRPTLSLSGKMTLNIPSPSTLNKELKSFFGLESIEELEEFSASEIAEALQAIFTKLYGKDSGIIIYLS